MPRYTGRCLGGDLQPPAFHEIDRPQLEHGAGDGSAAQRLGGRPQGLARCWGPDLEQAYQVAARMDTGTVWVNKHLDLPPDIPFAGAKQSGLGAEMGPEGLEEFTQPKVIHVAKN